jgi:hypothetical protein
MHPVVRAILQAVGVTKTYLYKQGDECAAITGGWALKNTYGSGTYTEYADHMFIQALTGDNGYINAGTANMIDVTNYNTLYIDLDATVSGGGANTAVYVGTTINPASWSFSAAFITNTSKSRQVVAVDVSALTGNHYIVIQSSRQSAAGQTSLLNVYNVWLE